MNTTPSEHGGTATRPSRTSRRKSIAVAAAAIATLTVSGVVSSTAGATDPADRGGHQQQRGMGGACDTQFRIDANDPLLVHLTGTCTMAHLGRTTVIAEQRLEPLPDGTIALDTDATYTAANGHTLYGHFAGRAKPDPAAPQNKLLFSGIEWFVGGTGQFDDASGHVNLKGSAQFTGQGVGIGHFDTKGRISY